MLVNVSEPAKVARVPVNGSVTLVAAVEVKVVENAPAVIKEPPFTKVNVALVAGSVIVTLFTEVAVATPKTGVTRVGEANGAFKSNAACNPDVFAIDTAASAIAVTFPVDVTTPVRFAFVVTLDAVKPVAVPVMLVPTNCVGVPKVPPAVEIPAENVLSAVKVFAADVVTPLTAPVSPLKLATPVTAPVTPLKLETIFGADIFPVNVAPVVLNPPGRFNRP